MQDADLTHFGDILPKRSLATRNQVLYLQKRMSS